jgi:hypothetical protein
MDSIKNVRMNGVFISKILQLKVTPKLRNPQNIFDWKETMKIKKARVKYPCF